MELFPSVPTIAPSRSSSKPQHINNSRATSGNSSSNSQTSTMTNSQPTEFTKPPMNSTDFMDAIHSTSDTSRPRKWNTEIPTILPHEKVFPIQIGSECFKLSGASISSDAPSYFSQYFRCQLRQAEEKGDQTASVRTLYIDRDPVTFKDICLHLQGYHVQPRDASHFVRLFADALFYNLPRLMSQLHEENIFISIGNRNFQIPRDLFSDPGNSPNYFSLGFAVFFSQPNDMFPGMDRESMLRPPSIIPPSVPNRSADTFAELLHFLRGYPIHIKDADHRAELLRDCRYFHLKGLEQKLIRHDISFNPLRNRHEIVLRIEDVRQSGISVIGDPALSSSQSPNPNSTPNLPNSLTPSIVGHVNYARPFVDSRAYELVLEIGDSCTQLRVPSMRAEFFGDGKARISRLFEVIATKLNLPTSQPLGLLMAKGGAKSAPASPGNTPLSEDLVRCAVDPGEAWVEVDGLLWDGGGAGAREGYSEGEEDGERLDESPISTSSSAYHLPSNPRKRRRMDISSSASGGEKGKGVGREETWLVKTGQWRLRVQNARGGGGGGGSSIGNGNIKGGVECVLVAVRIEAVRGEKERNKGRGFLRE